MNNDMSTTEFAAHIRKTLKQKHGITSRQVSVRADHFSMGSAIRVRINDANISHKLIDGIAKQAESIRRCEYSGEILSGGNRYVTVSYDSDAQKAIANKWIGAVDAAYVSLVAEPGYIHEVPGTDCRIGASRHGLKYGVCVWGTDSYVMECIDIENAAYVIGAHMLNAQVTA
jgi:hypothetical protein